jgi:hypothetical protein
VLAAIKVLMLFLKRSLDPVDAGSMLFQTDNLKKVCVGGNDLGPERDL